MRIDTVNICMFIQQIEYKILISQWRSNMQRSEAFLNCKNINLFDVCLH
jgi:hypothetical protein